MSLRCLCYLRCMDSEKSNRLFRIWFPAAPVFPVWLDIVQKHTFTLRCNQIMSDWLIAQLFSSCLHSVSHNASFKSYMISYFNHFTQHSCSCMYVLVHKARSVKTWFFWLPIAYTKPWTQPYRTLRRWITPLLASRASSSARSLVPFELEHFNNPSKIYLKNVLEESMKVITMH